jgi:two-component system, NarL family, sensor kinase
MSKEIQGLSNSIIIGTIVFLFLSLFIIGNLLLYFYKRKKHFAEKKKLEADFYQALLQTQLEIQEQTFKTISQEIHDNIGQMLSLAKMNLSKFEIDRQHSDEAVLNAKKLVSNAVNDLRDLSKTLNADAISTIGLMKSIDLELQLVEKTAGIKTAIDIKGAQQRLEPQKELIVFRIVQESLHNSIKHALPKHLNVQANFVDSVLHLSICDDGTGFDYSAISGHGSGLRNMQSRSKLIGADWSIESSPGNGTTIILTIPIATGTKLQHDNNSIG